MRENVAAVALGTLRADVKTRGQRGGFLERLWRDVMLHGRVPQGRRAMPHGGNVLGGLDGRIG
jgi:hypothetical protein